MPNSLPTEPSRFEPPKVSAWKFWTGPDGGVLFATNLIIFLVLLCAVPLWMFGAGQEVALIASGGALFWYLFETFLRWRIG